VSYSAQTWRNQRERRFHPTRDAARSILSTLTRRLPTVRYQECDTSFVVTTYLDSHDSHYLKLAEVDDGVRSVKMRLREYMWRNGTPDELHYSDSCYLERKQRNGDLRLKERIEVPKRDAVGIVLRDKEVPGNCSESDAIRRELGARRLKPVIVSAYERRVFGDEAELRVTYDERIGFYPPPRGLYELAPALTPEVLGPPLASGPSRIIEVKQPAGSPAPKWLEELLGAIGSAPGYSKFRDGMRAMESADGRPVDLTRRLTPIR